MFRISFLIWLVALSAFNLVVWRCLGYLLDMGGDPEPVIVLVGLMPLFDIAIITAYFIGAKHFRITIRRERGNLLETFGITIGMILCIAVFISIVVPQHLLQLMENALGSYAKDLPSFENGKYESMAILGALLGGLISGPLIVIAIILALVMSQFKLTITRR